MPARCEWMYKWNDKGRFHRGKGRKWDEVFDSGAEFTGYGFDNPFGRKLIPEVAPGDVIIAYQTDRRAAVGICEVLEVETNESEPRLRFVARRRFASPVKLHDLKRSDKQLSEVEALRQGPVQILYRLTPDEAGTVLNACGLTKDEVRRLL